jgi:hypothetical protein
MKVSKRSGEVNNASKQCKKTVDPKADSVYIQECHP